MVNICSGKFSIVKKLKIVAEFLPTSKVILLKYVRFNAKRCSNSWFIGSLQDSFFLSSFFIFLLCRIKKECMATLFFSSEIFEPAGLKTHFNALCRQVLLGFRNGVLTKVEN